MYSIGRSSLGLRFAIARLAGKEFGTTRRRERCLALLIATDEKETVHSLSMPLTKSRESPLGGTYTVVDLACILLRHRPDCC